MNRISSLLAAALVALFALVACSKPKPPKIEPKSVSVKTITPAGMTLLASFDVINPNSFTISVRRFRGDLILGSGKKTMKIGPIDVPSGISVPGGASQTVSIDVTGSWNDFAAVAGLAAGGDLPYTLQGKVTVGGKSLNVDLPVTLSGKITQSQMIQASINSLGKLKGGLKIAPPARAP